MVFLPIVYSLNLNNTVVDFAFRVDVIKYLLVTEISLVDFLLLSKLLTFDQN